MTHVYVEAQADEISSDNDTARGYAYDGEATVRISTDAEDGTGTAYGPLSWLNSARITTDPSDDAVHCVVSVGDPRGGFCFTVRRHPGGQLMLHMPHPGEGMAHYPTRELHDGTLIVVSDTVDANGEQPPVDFSDECPDGIEVWESGAADCPHCDTAHPMTYIEATSEQPCLSCGDVMWEAGVSPALVSGPAWWYWSCQPGCLPDSDPMGPYDSERDAIAATVDGSD